MRSAARSGTIPLIPGRARRGECLAVRTPEDHFETEHTGDLRRHMLISDFYSARQWHSTGMYQDCCKPYGNEHELMLCLPAGPRVDRRPRTEPAAGLHPRARPGFLRP